MATTQNNTLPNQWADDITYSIGDTVSFLGIIYRSKIDNNLNHQPGGVENEYWEPLNIYLKEETVMNHDNGYSGDESFWERDNIYIDPATGYVYVNNENTGINVKGPMGDISVSFDDLTPEQIEHIRGIQGPQGIQGPAGPQGPEGPMGQVVLTPEQVAVLKGEQGDSAYQTWLNQGHTGTEQDFLNWLRSQSIVVDNHLSTVSTNPVQNMVISNYIYEQFQQLRIQLATLQAQVNSLQSQIQTEYNDETYNFQFGITENGRYGYIKKGTTTVIPFDDVSGDLSTMYTMENGMVFVGEIAQNNSEPIAQTNISNIGLVQPTSLTRSASIEADLPNIASVSSSDLTLADTVDNVLNPRYDAFVNGKWGGLTNTVFNLHEMRVNDTYIINKPISSSSTDAKQSTGVEFEPGYGPASYSFVHIRLHGINSQTSLYSETVLYVYNNITYTNGIPNINFRYTPLMTINLGKTETKEITIPMQVGYGTVILTPYETSGFKISEIYYK